MSEPGKIEDQDIVVAWLYGTLADDDTLTGLLGEPTYISEDPAPAEWGEGPLVTFGASSLTDVRGVGTARIMANDLWLVKATGRAESSDVLGQIAARIDLLLSDTTAVVEGGTILNSHRDARYRAAPSDEQGTTWRSVGGLYRILSQ